MKEKSLPLHLRIKSPFFAILYDLGKQHEQSKENNNETEYQKETTDQDKA